MALQSITLLKDLRGHATDVNHCQWSPIEPLLISAGGDKVVRVWNVSTGEEHPSSPLTGHSYYVNACVFSPSGDLVATPSSDKTIRLWSTTTWTAVGTLSGHGNAVRACSFSPDGTLLATGGADFLVKIWEVNSMRCITNLDKHDSSVTSCSFAPVGWLLASGGSSGEVILYDIYAKKALRKTETHDLGVNWVEFAHTDPSLPTHLLATTGQDSTVKLWNVTISQNQAGKTQVAMKLHRALSGHSGPVYCCQFSPVRNQLVSCSADKTVIVWDLTSYLPVITFEAHHRYVTSCSFSPDGRCLASTANESVKIWSMEPSGSLSSAPPTPTATAIQPAQPESRQEAPVPLEAVEEVCQWVDRLAEGQSQNQSVTEKQQAAVLRLSTTLHHLLDLSPSGDALKCPITQELFQDPVVASDGFTYERSAIMSWLNEGKRTSPVTNLPFPNTILLPNTCIKTLVKEKLSPGQESK